jgi:hypothetical protein
MLHGANSGMVSHPYANRGREAVDAVEDGPYGNWIPTARAGTMGRESTWWCRCSACGDTRIMSRKGLKLAHKNNATHCAKCKPHFRKGDA